MLSSARNAAGAIPGFFIGLIFIFVLSPWSGNESLNQERAKHFKKAPVVAADVLEEGYLITEGRPEILDPILCPSQGQLRASLPLNWESGLVDPNNAARVFERTDDVQPEQIENCVYVKNTQQQYVREEVEECGDISSNQTIVRQLADRCDDNGCERCYLVAEFNWDTVQTTAQFSDIRLGSYLVEPNDTTVYIGASELTDYARTEAARDPAVGDLRNMYDYMVTPETVLVAGDAADGVISTAEGRAAFVVSNKNYDQTLVDLSTMDTAMAWVFRIASAGLMIFGFVLLIGPLTVVTDVANAIPFVGRHFNNGVDAILRFVAGIVGFLVWIVMYLVLMVVNNIFIAAGVVILTAGVVYYLSKRKNRM